RVRRKRGRRVKILNDSAGHPTSAFRRRERVRWTLDRCRGSGNQKMRIGAGAPRGDTCVALRRSQEQGETSLAPTKDADHPVRDSSASCTALINGRRVFSEKSKWIPA